MRFKKSVLLATSSVLVIQNIAEASTPPILPLEDNPDSSPPQQNQSKEDIPSRVSTQGVSPESSTECEPLSGTPNNSQHLKNGNTTAEPHAESPTSTRKIPCVSSAQSLILPPTPLVFQGSESATLNTTKSQIDVLNSSKTVITTITPPAVLPTKDTSDRDLSSIPRKPNQSQVNPSPIRLIQVAPPETISNCESSVQDKYNVRNSTNITAKIQSNVETAASQKTPPCIAARPSKNSVTDDAFGSSHQEQDIPNEPNDSIYIKPPQIIPNSRLSPFTTTIPLNGNVINHLTEWETSNSVSFGHERSSNLDLNAIVRVHSQVEQSLTKNNVFTSDQRGLYLQLQTVRTNREIELQRQEPQTMQGLIIQETFTGSCLGQIKQESSANAQCSFTPPLVTDRNSIDPKLFFPTRINQFGKTGDVVSPETLAILAQPGFQNVGANGQVVGLDLYFPNLGTTPGNSDSTRTTIARREDIETTQLLGFSRVRQILRANSTEAALGRTIRGTGFIIGDDNLLLNTSVALSTEILPDAKPQLNGSTTPVNTHINPNLFRAANNTWIPLNSWTIYQGGLGRAAHAQSTFTEKVTLPNAHFNSLWIGLSPVTERSRSTDVRYVVTGPERVTVAAGGEGGPLDSASFFSNVNGSVINSADLQNFYTQIYLTFLNRNVDLITVDKLTERTTYHPHLSFTGNITNTHQVFRYYAGAIVSNSVKAYLGVDYSKNVNNWLLEAEAIGYINPDRDYFSHIQTSLARSIQLGSNANVSIATGVRYAFNQTSDPLDTPVDNYVSLGARANLGPVSVGVTQYFDGLLPHSIDTALGVDASLQLGSQGRIGGYISPSSNLMSYGAIAQYQFGKNYNSPTLVLGWRRDRYDFGNDAFEHPLETDNDVFTILFRLGSPTTSFRVPG